MTTTSVNSIAFSKNSEFLAAGLADGQAKIWNLYSKSLSANLLPSLPKLTGNLDPTSS